MRFSLISWRPARPSLAMRVGGADKNSVLLGPVHVRFRFTPYSHTKCKLIHPWIYSNFETGRQTDRQTDRQTEGT